MDHATRAARGALVKACKLVVWCEQPRLWVTLAMSLSVREVAGRVDTIKKQGWQCARSEGGGAGCKCKCRGIDECVWNV